MALGCYLFGNMDRAVDSLLDARLVSDILDVRRPVRGLAMDVVEKEKAYEIRADAPGLDTDNVTVEVKDRRLFISGERNEETEEVGSAFVKQERKQQSFSRSFLLPEDADIEAVDAKLDKGVLTVSIAKLEKSQAGPKKIEVKSS